MEDEVGGEGRKGREEKEVWKEEEGKRGGER